MNKLIVIIMVAALSSCVTTPSKDYNHNNSNLTYKQNTMIQDNIAQREQKRIYHDKEDDSDQKITQIKAMFAERNIYNRQPVEPRLEGKSQVLGGCKRVSLQAKQVPLSVFLEAVAGDRTVRIINPNGYISMDTEINVNALNECDETLIDRILTNVDIAYTINNDVVTVMPTITKSYKLPIIKPKQTYSSSSQTGVISGSSGGRGGRGSSSGGGGGKMSFVDSGVDPFKELKENVKELLDSNEENKDLNTVIINRTEGTIIVTTKPSGQRKVEKFISSYTKSLNESVMVTATILEVNQTDLQERGISMDMLFNSINGAINVTSNFGGLVQGNTGNVRLFNNNASVLTDIRGVLKAQGIQFKQRTAPSAVVDNRTGATLKVGGSEQYVKSIDLVSSAGTTGTTGQALPAPKLAVLQTGVQMEIWPAILDDKIIAQVHLSIVNKKGTQSFTFTNVGTFNSPLLSTSEVNTKITMKNGNTAVIQGLTSTVQSNTSNGFPILGDIPVIGALFGHKRKEATKNEAIVFLTLTKLKNN